MRNKHYISLIGIVFYALVAANVSIAAAPANDLCSGAIAIAVDGTCTTGQTTTGAGQESFGGCVTGDMSVWYSLTLTGANNYIDVTLPNETMIGDVELFLTAQTCGSITEGYFQCGDPTLTYTFSGLSPGGTYLLMVSNATGDDGGFDLCVTEGEIPGSSKPPNQPEQNCDGALTLCSSSTNEINSYQGYGTVQELSSTCLAGDETNSVWYMFTVQDVSLGTVLGFDLIIPSTDLYDFALYDITTIGCAGIPSASAATNPVRCNWATVNGPKSLLVSTATTTLPPLSENTMGSPTMPGLNDVYVGQTFALIIDNWYGYDNGYTLNFTGTAKIYDDVSPTFSIAAPVCGSNTITITMDEWIDCSTIVMADFVLTNTTTSTDYTSDITAAACGSSDDQIVITYNAGALPSGAYTFTMVANPSLADNCGNVIANTETIAFTYLSDLTLVSSVTTVCSGATVDLTAGGAPPSTTDIYTLNPGGLLASSDGSGNATYSALTIITSTVYTVSVTYGGCTETMNTIVGVQDNIIVSIDKIDPQICPGGNESLTATTTINGVTCTDCDYLWTTVSGSCTEVFPYTELGVASSTINSCVAETYSVQATTAAGCLSNTASSTITETTSGTSTTCNVYYVNPAGGGDGLTKTTPTDLATALSTASCTNSIIKMEAGVYTLADRVVVTSYLTVEGGYNAGFTSKSSDLSGGAATTVIRRPADDADTDDANGCTAFRIGNGSENFEIRNLRIEMPGAPGNPTTHTNGTNITNYGIRMGTTCTGYSIVRCYINTGRGSD